MAAERVDQQKAAGQTAQPNHLKVVGGGSASEPQSPNVDPSQTYFIGGMTGQGAYVDRRAIRIFIKKVILRRPLTPEEQQIWDN